MDFLVMYNALIKDICMKPYMHYVNMGKITSKIIMYSCNNREFKKMKLIMIIMKKSIFKKTKMKIPMKPSIFKIK